MKENPIQKRILLRVGRGISRFFRNNVGQLQDKHGNHIRYGVCNPGGSDLIGWRQIKIEPHHVGMTIAQFAALEVKRPGKKPTEAQERFGAMVTAAGGLFAVVHNADEAEDVVKSKI